MNPMWNRAEALRILQTVYAVLRHELEDAENDKRNELQRFDACANDPAALARLIRNLGFTRDACQRVISDVEDDKILVDGLDCDVAADTLRGDQALRQLYTGVWTNSAGQKPTDVIVLDKQLPVAILGDCKFGMISEDSGLLTDSNRLQGEFVDKCTAVRKFVKEHDNVDCRPKILFVVTSALVPLLQNRIEDYKLDPHYANIPLENILFCSASDIKERIREIATGE